jgi:3-methyladenine DNA glycosylase/8-oxoguanine DNA glycosylase
VAHAVVRDVRQLIEVCRAPALERRSPGLRRRRTQDALRRLSPAELRRLGLAQHRATALHRLAATLDFESLRAHPTATIAARLGRERVVGPWSVGVVALEGLGRYDHGLVGDLSLVKLHSSLAGRWVEGHETASLLARYGEWQGWRGRSCFSAGRGLSPALDRPRPIARRRARKGVDSPA